jgi:ABC-type multidrug transport system permease subunit
MNESITLEKTEGNEKAERYWPLGQLLLARLREFYREPEALFWVYGFPILIALALGFAFRNKPVERITVTVEKVSGTEENADFIFNSLKSDSRYVLSREDEAVCHSRLRTGKTDLVVIPSATSKGVEYLYDPTRQESVLARGKVDDTLQRAAGRHDVLADVDREFAEPGGRYIDFLIPGLLGQSLMGGGLWGAGFSTVDLRVRKVLKRFLATPMRKTDFLGAMMASRMLLLVPEVVVLLGFARLAFGVVIQGSLLAVGVLIFLGAVTFAGIGLLVACRAQTIETVNGLMNLVMLPMWVLSGVFFSSDRFPEVAQPFIKALPLTPLIDSLRNVCLEGASLVSQWPQIATLAAWAVGSFVLALKWFRWN